MINEKRRTWDKAFGFSEPEFRYKPWKSKDHFNYYLKDCPGIQISEPSLPF